MSTSSSQLLADVAQLHADSGLMHSIVHDSENDSVMTDGGPVMTAAAAIKSIKTFTMRGIWVTGTQYNFKDLYVDPASYIVYMVAVAHVSTTIGADLAAGKVAVYQGGAFQQAGTGATLRTPQDKMRDWYSATDFGLKGDGITDNSLLNAVFLSACAVTGRDAWYPDGTYVFATTYGSNNVLIPAPSNVRMFGTGSVIFRAAPGMNASRPYGWNFIFPAESTIAYAVKSLTVRGITFDHNGQNNLPTGTNRPKNAAVGAIFGSDITVEDCWTINNAGEQSFTFGTVDANGIPTCSNIFIRRIRARDIAQAAGNAGAVDHSTIFVVATVYEISDIYGFNDTPSLGTLVEAHGSYGRVFNICADQYGGLGNYCGTICDTIETVWGPNLRGKRVPTGITFWCYAGRTLEAVVEDGEFDFVYTTNHLFNASYNTQAGCNFSLRFERIRQKYKGGVNTVNVPEGLSIANCKTLVYKDNRAEGFLGRPIALGAVNAAGADIRIENNTFVNCSQTTLGGGAYSGAVSIGTPAGGVINRLVIKGNDAIGCKGYLYGVADVAMTISELVDLGNSVDSTMTGVGYIGFNNPILGAGKIMMKRIDNSPAEPNIRASVGSEITDRNTGIVWRRQAAGEGRVGWVGHAFGTAAPTAGYWPIGSKILNSAPLSGQPEGWVCSSTGTPGTWKALANVQ